MLYVLADTNVWLDLAKDVNGQKLIVAVRVLVHEKRLTLLVPELVSKSSSATEAASKLT